jgi:hypothetical protein
VLIQNHRMEGLSRAYVEAVAASVGLNVSVPRFDYGIDLSLSRILEFPDGRYLDAPPRLDLQLKSTTLANSGAESVGYDLDAKTYNNLASAWPERRILLVLIVMPEQESDWLVHSTSGLTLGGCGYWFSFENRPTTKNKRSIRISVPTSNLFSPVGLSQLFTRLEGKENW